jgi:hypothetical protein
MHQGPSFATNLIAVIAGLLLLMMTAAFVLVPYALSGHPGEAKIISAASQAYHPT